MVSLCHCTHVGTLRGPPSSERPGRTGNRHPPARSHDSTFSRTVWKLYGGSKGLVISYYPARSRAARRVARDPKPASYKLLSLSSSLEQPPGQAAHVSAASLIPRTGIRMTSRSYGVLMPAVLLPVAGRARPTFMKFKIHFHEIQTSRHRAPTRGRRQSQMDI